MNIKKKLTFAVLLLWICITFTAVIKNEYVLHFGREVLLRTVPVDPRDILMGDYVILNYEIGQYNSYRFKTNDDVYVSLKVDGNNIASVKKITPYKPDGSIFIKGKITGCNTVIPFFKSGTCISYGIENYYVKEGTGRELEEKLAKGTLVKVSISPDGSAKVKGFSDNPVDF